MTHPAEKKIKTMNTLIEIFSTLKEETENKTDKNLFQHAINNFEFDKRELERTMKLKKK